MTNTSNKLTRRSALQLLCASAVAGSASPVSAAKGSIPYGVAVHLDPFRKEPKMKQLLKKHADLIVPMNALKWASLRYDRGKFDFTGADEIIDFALKNGKSIHGHALLWYHANPKWLDAIRSARELEGLLIEHIETVAGRYADKIATWDVANEVLAHDPLTEGKWRRGIWYDLLGPRHVDIAFSTAARVAPKAKLFLNDYDLEDDSLRTEARQKAILEIVRRLQDKNIPIHGIGLQAHLYAERGIGRRGLTNFVTELDKLGLEIAVTELDVIDWKLSANIERRDRAVAATVREFLDALTIAGRPRNITTWGMNDAFSWIDSTFPRNDSAKARPLPFDRNWQAKPMFDTLKNYIR